MLGSQRWDVPLPEAVNITAGMPADVKPNPTAYAPETDALDYWESQRMLMVVKKPHVLGPQYKGELHVLGRRFHRSSFKTILEVWNLRPHAQKYSDDPDLCWESA